MTSDAALVLRARGGDKLAEHQLIESYRGFVRLKASSYFLLGGESDDLIQEGLLGLYKAIRDYRTDRESSFRNFAELCITRQIITAVKTATRNKHTPLNQYVSFSQTPAAAGDSDTTLDEILPGPSVHDPVNQVIASEELSIFVETFDDLSPLERSVADELAGGISYDQIAINLGISVKAVDNAAQRVRRKFSAALSEDPTWRADVPRIADRVRSYIRDHPDRNGAEIARGLRLATPNSVYLALQDLGPEVVGWRDGGQKRWRLAASEESEAA